MKLITLLNHFNHASKMLIFQSHKRKIANKKTAYNEGQLYMQNECSSNIPRILMNVESIFYFGFSECNWKFCLELWEMKFWKCYLKLRCDTRFQLAFTAFLQFTADFIVNTKLSQILCRCMGIIDYNNCFTYHELISIISFLLFSFLLMKSPKKWVRFLYRVWFTVKQKSFI